MRSNNSVIISFDQQMALVTLNRPESFNALNADLRAGLLDALHMLEERRDIRAVVISANGKSFCAGQDLHEAFPTSVYSRVHTEIEPLLMGLRRLDKVVIAAITGITAGIGLGLVAAADLAVMAEDTYVKLAFSKIGLVPDGGVTWELLHAMGRKRAYRVMIESGTLTAKECHQFGLVNEICARSEVLPRAIHWAHQISQSSSVANVLTKRALHQVAEMTLAGAIAYETELQDLAAKSADREEGVRAFLEKRPPNFC